MSCLTEWPFKNFDYPATKFFAIQFLLLNFCCSIFSCMFNAAKFMLRKLSSFNFLLKFNHFRSDLHRAFPPLQYLDRYAICRPQTVFFPIIKVSPQFLIKGISSITTLIQIFFSIFSLHLVPFTYCRPLGLQASCMHTFEVKKQKKVQQIKREGSIKGEEGLYKKLKIPTLLQRSI